MYVEHRWTGWWAECSACQWTAGPCDTKAEVTVLGLLHCWWAVLRRR
jgi:hypothetical protein